MGRPEQVGSRDGAGAATSPYLDDRGPEAALPGPDGFEYLAPLESSPSLRAADLGRLLNQLCFDLKAFKLTDRDEHRRAATRRRMS